MRAGAASTSPESCGTGPEHAPPARTGKCPDFTMIRGVFRHLRPLRSNQGYPAHQSHHILSGGASNHTQDHHGGTRAPGHDKTGHFPVRADGACSGHGQQLAGMSGATPAIICRPMTLILRPGALVMVTGLVPGQEYLVLLMIHSETRACSAARELPRKPDIQLCRCHICV